MAQEDKQGLVGKVIIIVVVVLCISWFAYLGYQDIVPQTKEISIDLEQVQAQHPEYAEMIREINEYEKKITDQPNNLEYYAQLGLSWKTLAEQSQEPVYFEKVREVYDKAIKLTNGQNSLFVLNAGDVSEILREYERAEEYYRTAVEKTSADIDGYLRLARLYRLRLDKSPEEILAVYDQGIATIVYSGQLVRAKADYLVEIGRLEEALDLYQRLNSNLGDSGLETIIEELKKQIN